MTASRTFPLPPVDFRPFCAALLRRRRYYRGFCHRRGAGAVDMRDRLKRYALLLTEWTCNALALLSVGFLLGAGWLLALLLFANLAHASEVTIPRAAQQYRATLVRAAHATWGLDAPVSVFARSGPYGKLVAQQHGFSRGGAGAGAIHAVHGKMAAFRCS